MRIAVFHNYMDNIGGAERVGLTLAKELGADLYSTNVDMEKIRKMGFSNRPISIGRVPLNAPFRQQMALWKFRHLNMRKKYCYYIIDGDWAMSGAVNNKPNLWYVHSPIREIWDLYQYTRKHNVPRIFRPVFDLWVHYNRYLNKKYVMHVDKIVCNSENTRKRVKKYLNRDAVTIHPPIETSKYHYDKTGDFWLSVNRLITHKRIDLQIEAFKRLPGEKLIIVGSYEQSRHFREYAEHIIKNKTRNVKILSWINFDALVNLYANCKGFITTSKEEDFGMTPVEAMASGKPVIAPNEGGYKETVIDGKTGLLINNINEEKLTEAIRKMSKELKEKPNRYKRACQKRAKEFDTKIFIRKIKREIER